MKRNKPKNEVEELEKQIRELKSINRALMRRLKKVDRKFKSEFDPSELEDDNEEKIRQPKRTCTNCERGELTEVNIVGRIFSKCTVCEWRSGVKKKES